MVRVPGKIASGGPTTVNTEYTSGRVATACTERRMEHIYTRYEPGPMGACSNSVGKEKPPSLFGEAFQKQSRPRER